MDNSGAIPKILFTAELTESQRITLNSTYFTIHSIPFISFDFVDAKHWLHQLPKKYDAWVFTSKRAVKAVKPVLKLLQAPDKIFAVGEKTAQKLEDLSFLPITPDEFNLKALAHRMNEFELNHIVHFCGNLRSGNLSELLTDKSVEITSIEVYQTTLISQKIDVSNYDAFVFMSPSAVCSFLQKNQLENESDIFCIGPSTANALQEHDILNFQMAEQATLDSLSKTIKSYYN